MLHVSSPFQINGKILENAGVFAASFANVADAKLIGALLANTKPRTNLRYTDSVWTVEPFAPKTVSTKGGVLIATCANEAVAQMIVDLFQAFEFSKHAA